MVGLRTSMFAQISELQPDELVLAELSLNLLLVLVMSHVLGWHFVRYAQVVSNKRKLARVFVLVSVTTLLIISVVKVSLALSLGLVGALSIIRFRTPVKEPEELAYLFLAIALGVGLGADRQWETALVFFVVMLVMALRAGLPGGKLPLRTLVQVSADDVTEPAPIQRLWPAVQSLCEGAELRRVDHDGREFHASFVVELREVTALQGLIDAVHGAMPGARVSVVDRNGLE